jgi:DNA-binding beta-propeller fold protein YncE
VPPHPTAVQVNPLTGHLLVASAGPVDGQGELVGSGTLSVLDMARGRTLHTIGVGILPGQISLDRPARRALVVNFTTNLDHTLLNRPPPESAWAGLLRRLKRAVPLLPVAVPPPPQVPSDVTVTVLDLAKL